MTKAAPIVPTCEACDAPVAPFGFTMTYEDEGQRRDVMLWFCRGCRSVGEELFAASKRYYEPGRASAMGLGERWSQPEPTPPAQGVLAL